MTEKNKMKLTKEKRLEFEKWIEEADGELLELAEALVEYEEHDWAFKLYTEALNTTSDMEDSLNVLNQASDIDKDLFILLEKKVIEKCKHYLIDYEGFSFDYVLSNLSSSNDPDVYYEDEISIHFHISSGVPVINSIYMEDEGELFSYSDKILSLYFDEFAENQKGLVTGFPSEGFSEDGEEIEIVIDMEFYDGGCRICDWKAGPFALMQNNQIKWFLVNIFNLAIVQLNIQSKNQEVNLNSSSLKLNQDNLKGE